MKLFYSIEHVTSFITMNKAMHGTIDILQNIENNKSVDKQFKVWLQI